MGIDMTCPSCNADIPIDDPWEMPIVRCPECKKSFELEYDEICTEDYSDCWDSWLLIPLEETDHQRNGRKANG